MRVRVVQSLPFYWPPVILFGWWLCRFTRSYMALSCLSLSSNLSSCSPWAALECWMYVERPVAEGEIEEHALVCHFESISKKNRGSRMDLSQLHDLCEPHETFLVEQQVTCNTSIHTICRKFGCTNTLSIEFVDKCPLLNFCCVSLFQRLIVSTSCL